MDSTSMGGSEISPVTQLLDLSKLELIPQPSADRITFLAIRSLRASAAILYVTVGATLAFRSHAAASESRW